MKKSALEILTIVEGRSTLTTQIIFIAKKTAVYAAINTHQEVKINK